MKINGSLLNCGGCPLHRRDFLAAGCAACGGALGLAAGAGSARAAAEKPRVRIIYSLHADVQAQPDWPNIGFDFRPVMARTQEALAKGCPELEFVASTATGPEEAKKIVESDAGADIAAYVIYQMNCWNRVVQTVVETKKPVLYVDLLYAGSGGFLVYSSQLLQSHPNFGFIASSRADDVVTCAKRIAPSIAAPERFGETIAAVRRACTQDAGDLSCKPDPLQMLGVGDWREAMKRSKVLLVGRELGKRAPAIRESLGIDVVEMPFQVINDAWQAADKDQAGEVADRWQKSATKVADVSRAELENSAAMYLGMKSVLKAHQANAVTVNCLGGFYGGHIHAYPCLGFHELCNEGLIGGCEGDLRSAVTMVALSALTQGRTGFISDPVIDVAARRIIYAHCVASNRPFGPKGAENPFEILTHSEDRKGAAIRSLMPEGYMTTTVEFEPARKEILFHQGKSVGNDLCDRACRTKLAVEPVGDLEKLFRYWGTWGWHRVTAYGDLKEPIFALADQIGWKVVEEA
ncbi:MAG: hypothetical protein GXY83_30130 [Rhodopirellula sp.]|nr:hypothetical protein [Rhodopirellula sp.]